MCNILDHLSCIAVLTKCVRLYHFFFATRKTGKNTSIPEIDERLQAAVSTPSPVCCQFS